MLFYIIKNIHLRRKLIQIWFFLTNILIFNFYFKKIEYKHKYVNNLNIYLNLYIKNK